MVPYSVNQPGYGGLTLDGKLTLHFFREQALDPTAPERDQDFTPRWGPDEAATKIQAAERGRSARKATKEKTKGTKSGGSKEKTHTQVNVGMMSMRI
eukprot:s1674_g3.t1